MATKKAASTKKATASKSVASKTTVRTVRADSKPETSVVKNVSTVHSSRASALPNNIVNIVLAELVGTFILTLVALATLQDSSALYVGLTLGVVIFAVGAISGAHINPAVTFGLWASRKLKSILVPFYWISQLLGAMLALIVTNWVTNSGTHLSFGQFAQFNWGIFSVELIATAVFLFGFMAVFVNRTLSNGVRAIALGLTLTIGLVAGGSLFTNLRTQDIATYQESSQNSTSATKTEQPKVPYSVFAKGVTANPAVALASTNHSESELGVGQDKTNFSYLTLSVIFGTLVGAALGGNLYLLIAGSKKD